MAGDSYRDGVRRRLLLAVPVGLGAALLFAWLDGDLVAAFLVGLVTVLSVALVPRPEERRRPREHRPEEHRSEEPRPEEGRRPEEHRPEEGPRPDQELSRRAAPPGPLPPP